MANDLALDYTLKERGLCWCFCIADLMVCRWGKRGYVVDHDVFLENET